MGPSTSKSAENLFSIFAILGGIGFITDAFKREGAPQGILYVAFKFTSLAFTLGLIVGGWGEHWWQLTIAGVAVGVIVGVNREVHSAKATTRIAPSGWWCGTLLAWLP